MGPIRSLETSVTNYQPNRPTSVKTATGFNYTSDGQTFWEGAKEKRKKL
jgi:hypothetical protein